MFVDLKAAIDNVDRKHLYEILIERGTEEDLAVRIISIYIETKNIVKVNEEEIGKFWTKRGVRQGCKLSADMFNIYLCDLEQELKKVSEGGIVI